jgi:UDPglucose 6-dehydrogenase
MEIAVIGAGYVGLVTAGGLTYLGHRVRLGEVNTERVEALVAGGVPIYEQGLPDLLHRARERELISFHNSNLEAIDGARFIFLCLPTPEAPDGRADLKYIHGVIEELASQVADDAIFVVKSTVPPGTVAALRKRLADLGSPAHIVSHPEFLREGRAVEDFLEPDRIVIGAYDDTDAELVSDLTAVSMLRSSPPTRLRRR